MNDNNEAFTYSYSSQQQEEIEKIRKKYVPEKDSKLDELRKLDDGVTKKGMIVTLTVGVISTLVLGIGMCCTMVWADKFFVLGIIVGVIGICGIVSAYPLYNYVMKKEREKIAPRILELTDELSQQK